MCFICDMMDNEHAGPMAEKLKGFLAGKLPPTEFEGMGVKFAKNEHIEIPDDAAEVLFMAGAFTSLQACAETIAPTITLHEKLLLTTRTAMMHMAKYETSTEQMAAMRPMLEVLQEMAHDEANNAFGQLIDLGKDIGVNSAFVTGAVSVDKLLPEEAKLIGERALARVKGNGFEAVANITEHVIGGDATELGRFQATELRRRYQQVEQHLEAVLTLRTDRTYFMEKAMEERHG